MHAVLIEATNDEELVFRWWVPSEYANPAVLIFIAHQSGFRNVDPNGHELRRIMAAPLLERPHAELASRPWRARHYGHLVITDI